ncbi:hypothetical protein ABZZ80_34900, partial [Streptomyces sp. NPDC006356]
PEGRDNSPAAPEPESPDGVVPEPLREEQPPPQEDPQSSYETRYVQDEPGDGAEPATPVDTVVTLPAEAPAAASTAIGTGIQPFLVHNIDTSH